MAKILFGHAKEQGGHILAGHGRTSTWSPAQLSNLAVWYDPSDIDTLYQDAAGTTPVTASGQPVGRIEDKSGNGHHATASGSARPTYTESGGLKYLAANGTAHNLTITGDISSTSTPLAFICGYQAFGTEAAALKFLFDCVSGRLVLAASANTAGQIGYFDGSWKEANINTETKMVGSWLLQSSGGVVRQNATQVLSGAYSERAITSSTRLFSNNLGTSSFLQANLFSFIVAKSIPNASALALAEEYAARASGVTL